MPEVFEGWINLEEKIYQTRRSTVTKLFKAVDGSDGTTSVEMKPIDYLLGMMAVSG